MQKLGLKTDIQGINLINEMSTGNLLAAAQEIEKLSLLYGQTNISAEQIYSGINDNARFNVYNLIDAALQNNATLCMQIINNLKNSGAEPTIILWAIARELRSLIGIATAIKHGKSLDQAMQSVWSSRKNIVKKALQQHSLQNFTKMLAAAARIDLIIKGATKGVVWVAIDKLYLALAGVRV